MKEQIIHSCESLIESRERIKRVFGWDGALINLACAGVYVSKGQDVNAFVLQNCKNLLKQKVSVFSNFRSTARSPIAALLATSENPEKTLNNGLYVYDLLKKEFWSSTYLPFTAMIIAQLAQPEQYEAVASRTRRIYNRMKELHPFLTSGEDSASCALLALSEKSDEQIINEVEACYQLLKPHFFSSNAVQALSHVLAIGEDSPQQKCSRTMELFDSLKAAGYKYGTAYELPTLGVLALSQGSIEQMVHDIVMIQDWLSSQKGFGFFSGISTKQRLMYAGILAQREYINTDAMQVSAVNSVLAIVLAQQAAMSAAVAASAAASASASSSS